MIFKNVDGIRDDIHKLLFPGNEPSLVTLLTYRSSERDRPADPEIELWDNKVYRFLAVSLAAWLFASTLRSLGVNLSEKVSNFSAP